MKTAIIILGDIKQIMLLPEDDTEKAIVKLFTAENVTIGSVVAEFPTSRGSFIYETRAGYLRPNESSEAVVLVIKPQKEEKK